METNSSIQTCFFITYDRQQIQDGRIIYIVAAIIATGCILPSITLNILLIRSLGASTSLKKPSTLLLYSLSISNLLMGAILQPVYLVKKIAELKQYVNLYCITGLYTYVVGYTLATASLFTLTVIAIDRYFIVHWGLHYPIRVTQRRVYVTIVVIWVLSITLSTGQLYIPRSQTFPIAGSGMGLCVIVSTACYIQIVRTLRNKRIGVQQLNEASGRHRYASVGRYGKSAVTMSLVFLVFMICYLPYLCTMVAGSVLGESFEGIGSAESIVTAIAYTKSTINPIILFWRIREIQNALIETLSRLFTTLKGIKVKERTRSRVTPVSELENTWMCT